jgi:hypothetical protein
MGFTLFAVAVGLVLGIALGGRPRNVTLRPLRGALALGVAVVLQALPQVLELRAGAGLACVLASYVLLLVFALLNIRLVGMPIVLLGLALNVAVIGLNGGMPVRADAIRTVDPTVRVERIDFGAKRHLEDPDDRLTILGDVLPVPAIDQVLSFGDLILAFGVADVVFRLLKPAGAVRHRGRRRSVNEVLAMLPAPHGSELANRA